MGSRESGMGRAIGRWLIVRRVPPYGFPIPDSRFPAPQQHRIAVRKEAIALRDGVVVGGEDALAAGEGADHHHQGAFGQMEVGDHRVDAADAVAGQDEDLGFAGKWLQFAFGRGLGLAPGAFQRAHHCRAHRDHAAAAGAGAAYLFDQRGTDVEPLLVHHVLVELVHPHRLEGAGAHMQGDVAELHPALAQARQQRLVEVQPGGGRGDRADFAREHGLIALAVFDTRLAADIGRQRQAASLEQPVLQRGRDLETQQIELAIAAQHLGLAAGIERDHAAGLGRLAGADLYARLALAKQALDQDLHSPAAGLLPEQARRNDPGVVEDQQIAGLQQLGQIAHLAVAEGRWRRRHHQQAAGGTFGQRRLGDQFFGQLVMEIGLLQGRRIVGGVAA